MRVLRFSEGEEPALSVCVPTLDFDSGKIKALETSLEAVAQYSYELVVADCQGELLGYTTPMNRAMAAGRARYLAALNDDIEVTHGWEMYLISALMDPRCWCATPDATHSDGPQVFAPYCMMWKRTSWEEIGGLDERFVLWGSDIDLARRLVDAGHPPVKVELPEPIRHELNATTREHPDLGQVCVEDLQRFREKWGVDAEAEKHRLAGLQ